LPVIIEVKVVQQILQDFAVGVTHQQMDSILLAVFCIEFNLYLDSICVFLILGLVLTLGVEVKELLINLAHLVFLLFLVATLTPFNILLSDGFNSCLDFLLLNFLIGVDSILDHLVLFSDFVDAQDLTFVLV